MQGIISTLTDVSELQRALLAKADAEDLFQNTFELTGLGMSQVGLDGCMLRVNRKCCDMFGASPEQMLQTTWMALTHPADLHAALQLGRKVFSGQQTSAHLEARGLRPDGSSFWLQLTMTLVRDEQRKPLYWMGVGQDISERKAAEFLLQQRGNIDALTGTTSRRRTIELANKQLALTGRYATPLSLLMMDLDHFKLINDAHGHAAGDQVLVHFANGVRALLREVDVLGRWGGEEFVVLLPQTDLAGALALAERMVQTVSSSAAPWGDQALSCTVSIGAACAVGPGISLDHLLQQADNALYQAKQRGRNQAVAWQESACSCGVSPQISV